MTSSANTGLFVKSECARSQRPRGACLRCSRLRPPSPPNSAAHVMSGRDCAQTSRRRGSSKETRGTAYVVYEDIYDAKEAADHLSGFNVANRYLIVLFFGALPSAPPSLAVLAAYTHAARCSAQASCGQAGCEGEREGVAGVAATARHRATIMRGCKCARALPAGAPAAPKSPPASPDRLREPALVSRVP